MQTNGHVNALNQHSLDVDSSGWDDDKQMEVLMTLKM